MADFTSYQMYIDGEWVDAIYDYTQTKTVWINTSSDPIADPFVMQ